MYELKTFFLVGRDLEEKISEPCSESSKILSNNSEKNISQYSTERLSLMKILVSHLKQVTLESSPNLKNLSSPPETEIIFEKICNRNVSLPQKKILRSQHQQQEQPSGEKLYSTSKPTVICIEEMSNPKRFNFRSIISNSQQQQSNLKKISSEGAGKVKDIEVKESQQQSQKTHLEESVAMLISEVSLNNTIFYQKAPTSEQKISPPDQQQQSNSEILSSELIPGNIIEKICDTSLQPQKLKENLKKSTLTRLPNNTEFEKLYDEKVSASLLKTPQPEFEQSTSDILSLISIPESIIIEKINETSLQLKENFKKPTTLLTTTNDIEFEKLYNEKAFTSDKIPQPELQQQPIPDILCSISIPNSVTIEKVYDTPLQSQKLKENLQESTSVTASNNFELGEVYDRKLSSSEKKISQSELQQQQLDMEISSLTSILEGHIGKQMNDKPLQQQQEKEQSTSVTTNSIEFEEIHGGKATTSQQKIPQLQLQRQQPQNAEISSTISTQDFTFKNLHDNLLQPRQQQEKENLKDLTSITIPDNIEMREMFDGQETISQQIILQPEQQKQPSTETSSSVSIQESFTRKQNSDILLQSKASSSLGSESESDMRLKMRKNLGELFTSRLSLSNDCNLSRQEIMELSVQIELEIYKFFKDTSFEYKEKYLNFMINIEDTKNFFLNHRVDNRSMPLSNLLKFHPNEVTNQELNDNYEKKSDTQLKRNVTDMITTPKSNVITSQIIENDEGIYCVDSTVMLDYRNNYTEVSEITKKLIDDENEKKSEKHAHINTSYDNINRENFLEFSEATNNFMIRSYFDTFNNRSNPTVISKTSDKNEENLKVVNNVDASEISNKIWRGFIDKNNTGKFLVTAEDITGSGKDIHRHFPNTLKFIGTLKPDLLWAYIREVKISNKEIFIVKLLPYDGEEREPFISLFNYLNYRKCLGVLNTNFSLNIKDFYIVPFSKNSKLPGIRLSPKKFDFEKDPLLFIGVIIAYSSRKRTIEEPLLTSPVKITRSVSYFTSQYSQPNSIFFDMSNHACKQNLSVPKKECELTSKPFQGILEFPSTSFKMQVDDDELSSPVELINDIKTGSILKIKDNDTSEAIYNEDDDVQFIEEIIILRNDDEQNVSQFFENKNSIELQKIKEKNPQLEHTFKNAAISSSVRCLLFIKQYLIYYYYMPGSSIQNLHYPYYLLCYNLKFKINKTN